MSSNLYIKFESNEHAEKMVKLIEDKKIDCIDHIRSNMSEFGIPRISVSANKKQLEELDKETYGIIEIKQVQLVMASSFLSAK
jgi:hypothetical protein